MALRKVSVWDARLADVTSEDRMEGMGRWKGILNMNYHKNQFAGRCWVMYDIPDESIEYDNINAMARALGWTIEEYEDHLSGPFDTSKSGAIGKRPVMHIDAEMYVAEDEKTDGELLDELRRWSDDNDRMLGAHFTNSLSDLAGKSNTNDQLLGEHILSTTGDLRSEIQALSSELSAMRSSLTQSLEDRVRIAQWSFGQYTVSSGQSNNILFAAPTSKIGDNVFSYNDTNKSFKVNVSNHSVNRILRVTVSSNLSLDENYTGHTAMHVKNIAGGTQGEQIVFLNRQHGVERYPQKVNYMVELFLSGEGSDVHPVYTDGLRIEFKNSAGQPFTINPGNIFLTLLSV